MKVRFIAGTEDLDAIRKVIKDYESTEFPHLSAQLNHVRIDNAVKIRITIDGNDKDVKGLVDVLTSSFFLS